MSYINFDKTKLVNLEYSLKKEILRTSRSGSYSSTTIVGCNTRKYHGLLVSPVDNFDSERYVLLSALDVSVAYDDKAFNMGLHKFDSEHYSPKGHKYLKDFSTEPVPSMVFEVGTVRIRQERVLSSNTDQVMIKYTLENSPGKVRLQFRPLLAFRRIHDLTVSNMYVKRQIDAISNGIRIKMYDGFPYLNMQFTKETEFVSVPDWIRGIEYPEEQIRGYDYKEDLYIPGYFETVLGEGESIVFSASTEEINPAGLKRKFSAETKVRIERDNFRNCLINSAQQFIVKRGGESNIIAGYHWFGSWGRDTFIALPGLTLSIGDTRSFREVMDTQVKLMQNGLFPNMGTPGNPAFNSVDAPLWFIWAVQQYHLAGEKDAWTRYGSYVWDVIRSYIKGTSFGIEMRENGLIYAASQDKALTWMDAITSDGPVTPRAGYNVEINALWYNAICFVLEMIDGAKNKDVSEVLSGLPEKIKGSFIDMFWLKEENYLADYVCENGEKNVYVRPNMVFATSLQYRMLDPDMEKGVLDRIEGELLTDRGLRTLSPKNRHYKGVYRGNQYDRDSAYHQGTVWPWLLGHFCEGWLLLYGHNGVKKVREIIARFEDVMSEHGISSVSEVYDGDPPHMPGGTISQAWSVAELLRVFDLTDQFSTKKRHEIMRVLMFGWEFPPHISGGLGTASYGLTRGMSAMKDMDVLFVVPKAHGDEDQSAIKLIGANNVKVAYKKIYYKGKTRTFDKIEVESRIVPYTDPDDFWKLTREEQSSSNKIVETNSKGKLDFTGKYGDSLLQEIEKYAIVASVIASENEFDVIHAHDWLAYPAGIAASRVSGKPLVIHVHATDFDRSGGKVNPVVYEMEKSGMEIADKIIAVSNLTRDTIINRYGIDPAKVTTVYNAVEPVEALLRNPLKRNINDKVVTFLGRITLQKGPEYFIEAAYRVLQRMHNVRFVMAGSGDMMEKMMRHAASLNITDRFHFTGFLKGQDVYTMLQLSDVYIMPSVSEPFGISPLEAMQTNVPVIISKQSGVAEILTHAVKVDFWDIDATADAIHAILSYPAMSGMFKKEGKSEVESLKWENSARSVRKVYESAINN